ncbi:MAG: glycine cleavage system protein GcvH [Bacillota bacterium]
MQIINGLLYTKEHEWVKVEGSRATIGITDHAQEHLGEIVFVELPEAGNELEAGDILCVVESIKAASDVYTPVSGTVVEANDALTAAPEKINEAPYENWLAVVELSDEAELDGLMDAEAYRAYCEGLE